MEEENTFTSEELEFQRSLDRASQHVEELERLEMEEQQAEMLPGAIPADTTDFQQMFEDAEMGYFANNHVKAKMFWYLSDSQLEKLNNIETKKS